MNVPDLTQPRRNKIFLSFMCYCSVDFLRVMLHDSTRFVLQDSLCTWTRNPEWNFHIIIMTQGCNSIGDSNLVQTIALKLAT